MPKEINPTEERQLTLLLTLYNSNSGLQFDQIRNKMKEYYNNENQESDQKKLHRDIEDLNENGFKIKFQKTNYQSLSSNIYKFDRDNSKKKVEFEKEELSKLSALILRNFSDSPSISIFSAAQKIFSRNLDLFPILYTKPKIEKESEKSELESILSKLLVSIKDKIPLKMEYFKINKEDKSFKQIDPLQIIKRNTDDFYLLAFDREKREIRRYLILKILKITEIQDEFLFLGQIKPEFLNYHSLNFPVHKIENLEIECDLESIWILEKFLYPHPFTKDKNKIFLNTTNRSALFSFILRAPKIIQKINSTIFIHEFENFKNDILQKYDS